MQARVQIEMADHPQNVLDAMDRIKREASRFERKQRLGCLTEMGLLILGLALVIVDKVMGFGTLFLYAGIALILAAFGAWIYLSFSSASLQWNDKQFQVARTIIYTLRDDTGRRGKVVGWVDMSGPTQREKLVRTARSFSGKVKSYYRDPWFRVKFRLADGNLLRLSFVDAVKEKAGSVVSHQTTFTAKLVYNPSLYRLGRIPGNQLPLPGAKLSTSEAIVTIKASFSPRGIPIQRILEALKLIYEHLEPFSPGEATEQVTA